MDYPVHESLTARLEKAIEALVLSSLQILHHDAREGDKVDVYERDQLRKAFVPILKDLLRPRPFRSAAQPDPAKGGIR